MMMSVLFLVAGLVVLGIGAELLVRGGASLALGLRIRPLVVGLTVVAFGTSAPELAVSIRAALAGQGDVAAGNVVGSNIFNVAAILGLSAMICPLQVHARLIRVDIPIMLGVSLLAVAVLWSGDISRVEGVALAFGLLAYIVMTVRMARGDEPEMEAEAAAELPKAGGSIWLNLGLIVAGLGGLVLGADWFVRGAVDLARLMGMSEAVIGLTIVAAGTSLPELATSVVAAIRRHADIAAGNIIGSNIFNILGILGLSSAIQPYGTAGILPADMWVMVGFAVLLLPMAARDFSLKRWEGAVLMAGFAAYIGYRVFSL